MKYRKNWTTDEVQKLRQMYSEKESIKKIARVLDRSYLSVNKALDRYHIRPHRPDKKIVQYEKKKNTVKKPIRISSKKDPYTVDIHTIILNLKGRGFHVATHPSKEYPFLLNGMPKNAMQLLLECNRYRVKMGLPVYFLPESFEE